MPQILPNSQHTVNIKSQSARSSARTLGTPETYGTGIDWNEFHTATRYPNQTY
ncbi:hypothetical protein OZX72_04825 [Bifidobacterium sp. ESL0769]|uniref:hypothetical protein n=1 Tax=Bifidobacterium sp. ESL0769 TaxID=2983229 RepID=UPI0023FA0B06|nr:hypothetical protein [Bifidobacterium sp. ESL0769]WEV68297.1 hypothetical protein OZX72_04825 [Bifidobacterium sp. ESL0769]